MWLLSGQTPLLLYSKCIYKAPATTGILINMVHAQNKVRIKTDCGLKKK